MNSSIVLQGNTNPISSGVMFISSIARGGGGGESFDQSGTSGTPEGTKFPGDLCRSCCINQEGGHLQM